MLLEYSDLLTFKKIDKTVNAYATDDHFQKIFNHLVLKQKCLRLFKRLCRNKWFQPALCRVKPLIMKGSLELKQCSARSYIQFNQIRQEGRN